MLIGLAGKMDCGKSTVAKILCEKHGFQELSFAQNLKEMCKKVFNLTDHQVYSQEGKMEPLERVIALDTEALLGIHTWIKEVNNIPVTGDEFTKTVDFFVLGQDDIIVFRTVRELLQIVGTNVCRKFYGEDFHIRVIKDLITNAKTSIVISDARFPNEREALKGLGGFNVLIQEVGREEDASEASKAASENSLGNEDDYDFVLWNNKQRGLEVLDQIVSTTLAFLKV